MTTIESYLEVKGNDTDQNDLRTALVKEGFNLLHDIGTAASTVAPTLASTLENIYKIKSGYVGPFIYAANIQLQKQLLAQG